LELSFTGGNMSQLFDQLKKLKYDKRLLTLNMKTGGITKDEYEKHLQSLEDCADRAKTVKVTQASTGDSIN
jgi:exopolyphosphatase/pppGpp-phosphohydrolase